MRRGRTRTSACRRIWHDTASATLGAQGLALSEQAGLWRLERLTPSPNAAGAAAWPPAAPPPILAEAASPALLHRKLTVEAIAALVRIAAFTGTRRSLALQIEGADARLDVVDGVLRGVAHDEPACRLILSGPAHSMAALALQLGGQIPLFVPRAGLAARAIARAADAEPPPRQLGAPEIPPGQTVGDALALVTGHLTDVILHWGAVIPAMAAGDAEPVHQMRVAVRRLRSALAVFRRAGGEGARDCFAGLGRELKELAATLGAARDWDVFLGETGADLSAAFAGDKRVTALLDAAGRRRQGAYAALVARLEGAAWRDFALRLALLPTLRPWAPRAPDREERDEFGEVREPAGQGGMLAAPAASYAAQALQRCLKRVAVTGADLSELPPDALHDARKAAKQLRYACEFFAPLFPAKAVRRFLARIEDVQEALGAVNDSHVAAALMGQLSGRGDARFAIGVVQGFVAARSAPAARRAGKAWVKLLKQPVFWD
jgi:CHAD domain-containing protein